MTSYTTVYRSNHPEFREIQNEKNIERENKRYENDSQHKERKKALALARCYRLKEANASKAI